MNEPSVLAPLALLIVSVSVFAVPAVLITLAARALFSWRLRRKELRRAREEATEMISTWLDAHGSASRSP